MRIFKQHYKDRHGEKKQSSKWYCQFLDHREIKRSIPAFTDKGVTEELGRRLEKLVSLRMMGDPPTSDLVRWIDAMPSVLRNRLAKIGLLDSTTIANNKPLSEHIDDFISSLRNNGRSENYILPVEARIRRIVKDCGFRFITDISASQVESSLADLKKPGKGRGKGQRTINHYITAVKQFAKWLIADRRASENRLQHLKSGNAKLDIRRQRRELSNDELAKLLRAAHEGKKIYGLTGQQRYLLYAVAVGSGLRASELASLTPKHFSLKSNPPTVRIDAADEKSGRGDVLPIPADLVELIKPYLAQADPDCRIWDGTWAEKRRGHNFIQHDLKNADVSYRTDEGQADFHSLRHTYLSRLGRSGASPKAMQRLARHTTVELTLGKYTHANLYDLAAAVNGLPPLPQSMDDEAEAPSKLRKTGTDAADEMPRSVLPLVLP